MKPIRVLTYNIHKGFSPGNWNFVLNRIKQSIQQTHADIVFLQEVLGERSGHSGSQFEYLADQTWPHFAYGKNAVYTSGHHGNAILSKYPISFWENEDVSLNKIERRGLLHVAIPLEGKGEPLHAFCVHLGLFEKHRAAQIHKLSKRIAAIVPPESPLLIAGDFNDWNQNSGDILISTLGVEEAFMNQKGHHVKTYPSWFPLLALDRIYYRNLNCSSVQVLKGGVWNKLSDHLPLVGEFQC